MSPNQASGIDKRADIWVFGLAVVWPPFVGVGWQETSGVA